jgi:hypothetical protein
MGHAISGQSIACRDLSGVSCVAIHRLLGEGDIVRRWFNYVAFAIGAGKIYLQ